MAARCHIHRTQTTRMWPCPRPTFRYALPARGDTSQKFTRLALQESARSIKLGLGDFVFYSVLVSRAALFGFATFAACFVAVIMVRPLCVGGMESYACTAVMWVHFAGSRWHPTAAGHLQEGASSPPDLDCSGRHLLFHHPPCLVSNGCIIGHYWGELLKVLCALEFFLTSPLAHPEQRSRARRSRLA